MKTLQINSRCEKKNDFDTTNSNSNAFLILSQIEQEKQELYKEIERLDKLQTYLQDAFNKANEYTQSK